MVSQITQNSYIQLVDCSQSGINIPLSYFTYQYINGILTLNRLNSFIQEKIGKKLKLFNFYGNQIIDNSDLDQYQNEINKIIFLTRIDQTFENSNILKCFRKTKRIEEGVNGNIFLCEQIFTKMNYIMKVILYNQNNNAANLYKKLDTLKKIEHPGIEKLLNYTFVGDNSIASIFLINDFKEMRSLKEILDEKTKLDENLVRAIFKEILNIVLYFHNKNISHNNLRLENIYINENNNSVKIINFYSRYLSINDRFEGNDYLYISPESIKSNDFIEMDQSTDIWCLGCILHILVTGKHFLSNDKTKEFNKKQILNGNIKIGEDMTYELKDLLEKLLKNNEIERINTKKIFEHPWILNDKIEIAVVKNKSIPFKNRSASIFVLNSNKISIRCEKKRMTEYLSRSKNTDQSETTLPSIGNINNVKKSHYKMKSIDLNSLCFTLKNKNNEENKLKEVKIVPSHLQPIHNKKEDKKDINRIKEVFKKYYKINESNESNQNIKEEIPKFLGAFGPMTTYNNSEITQKIENGNFALRRKEKSLTNDQFLLGDKKKFKISRKFQSQNN